MAGIEIFDTEVFTGRLEGPIIHKYEFEFTQWGDHDKKISARQELYISRTSKFMVPLPRVMNSSGSDVHVSLMETQTGRSIFYTLVPLGSGYYHHFGTIATSAPPQLGNGIYIAPAVDFMFPSGSNNNNTIPVVLLILMLSMVCMVCTAWCSSGSSFSRASKKTSAVRSSPPRHSPLPLHLTHCDSVSTLTNTDHETIDMHSLAPCDIQYVHNVRSVRSGQNALTLQNVHTVQYRTSTTAAANVLSHRAPGMRTRRARRAVFNPYEDRIEPESELWDPWFNPSDSW